MVVTLGQQYNTGEKPTVILYTLLTLITMKGHQDINQEHQSQDYIIISSNVFMKITKEQLWGQKLWDIKTK